MDRADLEENLVMLIKSQIWRNILFGISMEGEHCVFCGKFPSGRPISSVPIKMEQTESVPTAPNSVDICIISST